MGKIRTFGEGSWRFDPMLRRFVEGQQFSLVVVDGE